MGAVEARSFSWRPQIAVRPVRSEAGPVSTNSLREYQMLAAECARLARIAPSLQARASFAAAAKSWLTLGRLAGEDMGSFQHISDG
jgi:hypothetical protein